MIICVNKKSCSTLKDEIEALNSTCTFAPPNKDILENLEKHKPDIIIFTQEVEEKTIAEINSYANDRDICDKPLLLLIREEKAAPDKKLSGLLPEIDGILSNISTAEILRVQLEAFVRLRRSDLQNKRDEKKLDYIKDVLKIKNKLRSILKETDGVETALSDIIKILTLKSWNHGAVIIYKDNFTFFGRVYSINGKLYSLKESDIEKCACIKECLGTEGVIIKKSPEICGGCFLVRNLKMPLIISAQLKFKEFTYGRLCISMEVSLFEDSLAYSMIAEIASSLSAAIYRLVTEKRERYLNSAITPIPALISIVSDDYEYLTVNNIYKEYYDMELEEIQNKKIPEIMGKDLFFQKIKPKLDECLAGNEVHYKIPAFFKKTGNRIMQMSLYPLRDESSRINGIITHGTDITELEEANQKMKSFEWLLEKDGESETVSKPVLIDYRSLSDDNNEHKIIDSVGRDTLQLFIKDATKLMDTMCAVYEQNGVFSFGVYHSEWCKMLVKASIEKRITALPESKGESVFWYCNPHAEKKPIMKILRSGTVEDFHCVGGLKIHAQPIISNASVIGVIIIAYGRPEKNIKYLKKKAEDFGLDLEKLDKAAESYKPRPPFIINHAKSRLAVTAEIIGKIVFQEEVEQALRRSNKELAIFNEASVDREIAINELRKEVNDMLIKKGMPPKYDII